MTPLHKQIQKYEDKLAKIKEREEKRAEAAKKNAGKADRKKPPIDRELKLPRFRGHPTVWVFGVHNGKEALTLRAGIPPADD
jgi:hypothetical protein